MRQSSLFNVQPIAAFNDNYIWLISDRESKECVLVDPGQGETAWQEVQAQGLSLVGILLTHYHQDHMGGVAYLQQRCDALPVYGPQWQDTPVGKIAPTKYRVQQGLIVVNSGDVLTLLNHPFKVQAVPGHTLEHINYQCQIDGVRHVFCGDSLFSAGCGRVFEGTMAQMLTSMNHYKSLPDDTWLYPAHEYTLSNLAFAYQVEPSNKNIATSIKQVAKLRQQGLPSLPVQLSDEKNINPFLRCAEIAVQQAVQIQCSTPNIDEENIFSALRKWKDAS